jgi:hypothetical protein
MSLTLIVFPPSRRHKPSSLGVGKLILESYRLATCRFQANPGTIPFRTVKSYLYYAGARPMQKKGRFASRGTTRLSFKQLVGRGSSPTANHTPVRAAS